MRRPVRGRDVQDKIRPARGQHDLHGSSEEQGVWTERCQGCGNCVLDKTLGICPVARCAKSIFNGPCGGSQGGSCEVNKDTPCAWQLIVQKMKEMNMLDKYMEIQP